jgi:iron complex outermembrane receptor protein
MMIQRFFLMLILVVCITQAKAQLTLQGKVTDAQSHPLSSVSIHLLNTQITGFTGNEGNFNIPNVPAGKYLIELSAIGYATMVKPVVVGNHQELLQFQLQNSLLQLEAVTVSAEKKEDVLQNLALSVTGISSREIQEYRLWNTSELTAIVPNLLAGNSGDERNVTSIRGITTTSYDPSVATYIDGVDQFSLDTYIPQLVDVQRIEVLRGPQGTLYGRNAMGGVINIITKQPTNQSSGFAEVNLGNYGLQRYSAGIRLPLIKNKLFFGAAAVYNQRNGYYFNLYNNTTFDLQKEFSGNYYLKFLPAESWAMTLNVKHQNNKNHGPFPLVFGVDEAFNHPFQLSQDALAAMHDNTLNASLSVQHTGTQFNISSQTACQTNYRYYDAPLDGDFSPIDGVTINNNYGDNWNKVKVFTEEVRLTAPPNRSSQLNWVAGAYFFNQQNPNKQATHFGKDAAMLGAPDTNFSTISTATGKNTGMAVYGQINYLLNRKWELIAGARFDYEHKQLSVKGEYQKDGQDAIVTQGDTTATTHFSAVSPKLGMKYTVSTNSLLFLTYSRGYRTGGLTQLSSDPSQPPLYPYLPEYSNNFELGIKNDFLDNRLILNVNTFLTYVNNAQVPTLILPDAITVTKNTGRLTSKGAELELFLKPGRGFQVDYSFGYTDAQYTSLKLAANGQTVNLEGKKQIFTPDVTSMLALQYSCAITNWQQLKLVARGEWFYLGTRYFDLANTIRQGSNGLLNVRAGISSKHADVFFWIRNISNRSYIEYAYDFGAVHLGNPKTLGVTLRAMF